MTPRRREATEAEANALASGIRLRIRSDPSGGERTAIYFATYPSR